MSGPIEDWISAFAAASEARNVDAAAELFAESGFWRDLLAADWTIQTLEGRDAIRRLLAERLAEMRPRNWKVEAPAAASEGFVTFETTRGVVRAHVRLAGVQAFTLLTRLETLAGHEARRGAHRWSGVLPNHANWRDRLNAERAALGVTEQPYVLIVGGGQAGLSLAAQLRLLDVPTLVVERHARCGDQWRSRYKSLTLHDPVWYDHMPLLPFPDHWPIYTPKDKMGDWLDSYAEIMELCVWTSAACAGARFDAESGRWEVRVVRNGREHVVRPAHLVLATGNAGRPNVPSFPGMESFAGVQRHSSAHPGGAGFAGGRVVVIGANNSAHDICADLAENGADVTMVQRSSTHVIRQETFVDLGLGALYSEAALAAGISTDIADMIAASVPFRMLEMLQRGVVAEVKRRDADFYAALERAGFMLDFGDDDTGIALKYPRRASGYYIDVGASQMIIDGRIRLKSGVGIERIAPEGVVLTSGDRLPADAIIYATGFGSMDQWAADLISPDVAARVGKVWGYGSGTTGDPGPWEGELRNMWKPTAQQGLWFMGGNLQQCRFYSHTLALQLKARHAGLAPP